MDTAIGIVAYVGALALTSVASLFLAIFVALRARALPGALLLVAFLSGVALWSAAQATPALFGAASASHRYGRSPSQAMRWLVLLRWWDWFSVSVP